MPKKKKDIIRVGDTVKIVDPHFFVRVGYPLDLNKATEEVSKKFGEDIIQLIKKMA